MTKIIDGDRDPKFIVTESITLQDYTKSIRQIATRNYSGSQPLVDRGVLQAEIPDDDDGPRLSVTEPVNLPQIGRFTGSVTGQVQTAIFV